MKASFIVVLSLIVLSGIPAKAGSLESLRAQGAKIEWSLGDPDPVRALRIARSTSDRAYRLGMDLLMMRRTVAETQAVLAAAKTDPARRERLEFLLKFLLDAYPVQGDSASYILDKVLYLKYEIPASPTAEMTEAVRAVVARVRTADESAKALRADVDALAAAVNAEAQTAGERSVWMSASLAEAAARMETYSAYVLPRAELLLKPGRPAI